jgi:hypothetical protein
MAAVSHPMKGHDAGDVAGSSRSMSVVPGLSDAVDARRATDPMDLEAALDRILSQPIRKGPRCTVGALLETLPDTTQDKIHSLLTTPRPDGSLVSATLVADALNSVGYQVRPDRVAYHRRGLMNKAGGCVCGRS